MKVMRTFEENLEYLGFDLAAVAWDMAQMDFDSDDDRIAVLKELSGKGA